MQLSYFMLMLLLVTSNWVTFKMQPERPRLVSFPRVDEVSVLKLALVFGPETVTVSKQ